MNITEMCVLSLIVKPVSSLLAGGVRHDAQGKSQVLRVELQHEEESRSWEE